MDNNGIRTWQQAKTMLAALKFDLGQSAIVIEDMFERGYYLKYVPKMNFWAWYKDATPEITLNGDIAQDSIDDHISYIYEDEYVYSKHIYPKDND